VTLGLPKKEKPQKATGIFLGLCPCLFQNKGAGCEKFMAGQWAGIVQGFSRLLQGVPAKGGSILKMSSVGG
jgi:hypothetical protein